MSVEDNLIKNDKTKKINQTNQEQKTKKTQRKIKIKIKIKKSVSNQSRMTKKFDPATMHPAAL